MRIDYALIDTYAMKCKCFKTPRGCEKVSAFPMYPDFSAILKVKC